jgi:transposase
MRITNDDTNLTQAQWAYLNPMLPKLVKRGRPPVDRRIIDAILYLVKRGCCWRFLPTNFPRLKTFIIFSSNGLTTINGPRSTMRCAHWAGKLTANAAGPWRRFWTVKVSNLRAMAVAWATTPASDQWSQVASPGGYLGTGARRGCDAGQHHRT